MKMEPFWDSPVHLSFKYLIWEKGVGISVGFNYTKDKI